MTLTAHTQPATHARTVGYIRGVHPRNEVLNAALALHAQGRVTIPMNVREGFTKVAYSPALIATGHKVWDEREAKWRATWKEFQTQAPTEAEVRAWYGAHGAPGLAMVTGMVSGVVCIDFDGPEGAALARSWGLRPHVTTPSGGWHVYVTHPGWRVKTLNGTHPQLAAWAGRVDVRADGGLAMLPPTVTFRGSYRLMRFLNPEPLAALPEEFRRAVGLWEAPQPDPVVVPVPRVRPARPRTGGAQERQDAYLEDMQERALDKACGGGGRDNAAFWLCSQLRDNGYDLPFALAYGHTYIGLVPQPSGDPYPLWRWETTAKSAYSKPARRAWGAQ